MLRNMTNVPYIFRYVTYSIYSHSPTCVPNMYSSQTLLKAYNIDYVTVVAAALLFMTVNYITILFVFTKSKIKTNSNANGDSANTNSLAIKIVMIISVKILAWTVIITPKVLYYLADIYLKDTTYEAIHFIVIPFNSRLNPIFNIPLFSSFYKFLNGKSAEDF